jgi:ribosome-binding protein aMBF1 (putative translation factor)
MTELDPKAAMREQFAQRLTAARMRKGWNQSELARNAANRAATGRDRRMVRY